MTSPIPSAKNNKLLSTTTSTTAGPNVAGTVPNSAQSGKDPAMVKVSTAGRARHSKAKVDFLRKKYREITKYPSEQEKVDWAVQNQMGYNSLKVWFEEERRRERKANGGKLLKATPTSAGPVVSPTGSGSIRLKIKKKSKADWEKAAQTMRSKLDEMERERREHLEELLFIENKLSTARSEK